MSRQVLAALVMGAALLSCSAQQQSGSASLISKDTIVTLADGTDIILHPDGSWERAVIREAFLLHRRVLSSCGQASTDGLVEARVVDISDGGTLMVEIPAEPYPLRARETVALIGVLTPQALASTTRTRHSAPSSSVSWAAGSASASTLRSVEATACCWPMCSIRKVAVSTAG